MQSYHESASPLITTLFIPYHVAFCFGGFWNFCGFHQDPHTAVRSKPDHPPVNTLLQKNMTSTINVITLKDNTVFILLYVKSVLWLNLAPVVQKVDNAIHWINLYPLDKSLSTG